MTLPPLANLFAVSDPDPRLLDDIERDLQTSGEFAEVWRPAEGWVAASAPLPAGVPDGDHVRALGLAFVEGRDVVARARRTPGEAFGELVHLADARPHRLAEFPGDFGFVRFRCHGSAVVVRSCGGLVPLYHFNAGARRAISTRQGDFVRYVPETFALDPLVNATWMSWHTVFPDDRAFLAGVAIQRRGCAMVFERDRPARRIAYWQPSERVVSQPTARQARERAEHLRALLISRLERDLDPGGSSLLTLSGGVDSSSLAALAVRAVGREISTWSLLPADGAPLQHELSFIDPLAKQLGITRRWTVHLKADTRIQLLRSAPRIVFHVMHPALCDLARIRRHADVRVLFGGEFADEVCGSEKTLPDLARACSAIECARYLVRFRPERPVLERFFRGQVGDLVGRPPVPFARALPAFILGELRAEYAEWLNRQRRKAMKRSPRRSFLAMQADCDGFVAMNWEATSAIGVRRCFPFFNREVLDLAFDCHPTELLQGGTKTLLRRALAADVPAFALWRRDKGRWGRSLRNTAVEWSGRLPDALTTIVRPDWVPHSPPVLDRAVASALAHLVKIAECCNERAAANMRRRVSAVPFQTPADTSAYRQNAPIGRKT